MKLSDDPRCCRCDGALSTGSYQVKVSMLFVDQHAAQATVGLATIFGGALGIAEVMSPDAHVLKVAGDEKPELWTVLEVCQKCALGTDGDPASLAELLSAAQDRSEAAP